MAYLEKEALFVTFLDLKKAYNALDCKQCLKILEGYGVKPRVLAVIHFFWENMVCVCKVRGFFGSSFLTSREATQGDPDSP